uniref:Uncharacterized protein LOC111109724 n=1 Tax=Crassostrea virginica TaxID=6565 RepID=A0A8B8BE40_CRAVI|nr:uncharacterized protein LOC111109724 [Crassostrea virginica]
MNWIYLASDNCLSKQQTLDLENYRKFGVIVKQMEFLCFPFIWRNEDTLTSNEHLSKDSEECGRSWQLPWKRNSPTTDKNSEECGRSWQLPWKRNSPTTDKSSVNCTVTA